MSLILLCLLIAIYFDSILFKQRDPELFKMAFQFSIWKILLSLLLILSVLIFCENRWEDLPLLVLLLVLPVYLLRRGRFVKSMEWKGGQDISTLISSALGVIIVWFYGVIAFGLLTSAAMDLTAGAISEMGDLLLSVVFSSFLIVILVYRSSRHFSDQGFLTNVGLRKGNWPRVKVVLIPAVLGLSFALFSAYLSVTRKIQPQTPLSDVLETTQSFGLILAFLFLAICVAPLIEEIVFRGYFFHIIKQWLGIRGAVTIIALTFSFLHVGQYWGDWLAIAMVTALGFTLTILRAWSGTTVASVITHYVYNGSVTILPIIIMAISNPAYLEYKAYYSYHDAKTKEVLLRRSIAKQPDLPDAYNDLAWLYAGEEKNLDAALALIEKALSYAPDYPAYLDTKAEVLEKLGRYDEAKPIRDSLKEK
ncbi:MAG: CPBP family intramembrane metalloprotease [Candidatus Omnitrophica bacterium]|nr:CPBP family intramembrane metalloprotease [Candidatus Omnitrophota bacterium]